MNELSFLIVGSGVEPYEVRFRKSGKELLAFCTCPAGENRLYCKHRFGILDGKEDNIVSGNECDVPQIQQWLTGTELEATLTRVRQLEVEVANVKKQLARQKKILAKTMHG